MFLVHFLVNMYWKILQISRKHPSSSNACFSSSSYSKLMIILSEASLIFQSMLLILFWLNIDANPLWSIPLLAKHVCSWFLCKIDEHPLWSIPPLPKHVCHSNLTTNRLQSTLKHPSSKACFLFNSYSKLMKTLSETSLIFYSISIQIWSKSSLKHPSASKNMFLIQVSFKVGEHLLWGLRS